MIKKFGIFLLMMIACMNVYADDFDFSEFAIVDAGNADLTIDPISLNADSGVAGVSGFDIAGIMLGMSFEDVQTLFFDNSSLYAPIKKHSIVYAIHKDWRYNLDYECRQQGIIIPSELEQCIRTAAKARGLMYASELHLERKLTGETIDVFFTSNATDNRVWRVVYNNDVDVLEGGNEKFENQRHKKILAFWQSVLEKYGAPNSGTDKWASSDNAYEPMMTAYYGSLELIDNGQRAMDDSKNVQQARENFQAKPYAF